MLGVPKESMRSEGVQPVAVPRGEEVYEYGANAMSFKLLLGGGEEAAKMAGNVEDLNDGMQFDRMMTDFGGASEKVVSSLKNDPSYAQNPAAWSDAYKEQMTPVMNELKKTYGKAFMGVSGLFKAEGEMEKAMKINLARVSKESMDRVGDMARDESVATVLYMRDMGNFAGAKSALGSPFIDDATRLRLSATIETGEVMQRYKTAALNDPMNVKRQLVAGDSLDGMKLNPAMRVDAMNFADNVLNQKQGEYYDGIMARYGETGVLPGANSLREDLVNQRISPSQFFRVTRALESARNNLPVSETDVTTTIGLANGARVEYAKASAEGKAQIEYKFQKMCDEKRIKGDTRSLVIGLLKSTDEDASGASEVSKMVEDKARIQTWKWEANGETVSATDAFKYEGSSFLKVNKGEVINGKYLVYERVLDAEGSAKLTTLKAKAQDMFIKEVGGKSFSKEERATIMDRCVKDVFKSESIEGNADLWNRKNVPKSEFTKAKEKNTEFVGASVDTALSGTQTIVYSNQLGGDDSAMGLAVGVNNGTMQVKVIDAKVVEGKSESVAVSHELAAVLGNDRSMQVVMAPDRSMFDKPAEKWPVSEKAESRAIQICESLGNTDAGFRDLVRVALTEYWATKK